MIKGRGAWRFTGVQDKKLDQSEHCYAHRWRKVASAKLGLGSAWWYQYVNDVSRIFVRRADDAPSNGNVFVWRWTHEAGAPFRQWGLGGNAYIALCAYVWKPFTRGRCVWTKEITKGICSVHIIRSSSAPRVGCEVGGRIQEAVPLSHFLANL